MNPLRDLAPANALPDLDRPDVDTIRITHWFVGSVKAQSQAAESVFRRWQRRPPELKSLTCFVSSDGETVLTYSQWAGDSDQRATAVGGAVLGSKAMTGQQEPLDAIRYQLYRTANSASPPNSDPGLIIFASFDVDGPERQQFMVDTICDRLDRAQLRTGGVSASFHISCDGTRILNYARWTGKPAFNEAHEGLLKPILSIAESTPGVRPIGFRSYELYRPPR